MTRQLRQPTLRTKSFHIDPNTHWLVKGSDMRRIFYMEAATPLGGFDIAFVPQGVTPEEDEWVDGWGKEGTGNKITTALTVNNGIASDIHIRDTNNIGTETLVFISDVQVELIQVS